VNNRARIRDHAATAIALLAALLTLILFTSTFRNRPLRAQAPQQPVKTIAPIYSDDPADPWNRIFSCLFSRRMEVRLSSDFAEGAPFMELANFFNFQVSARLFEREETGDRAIDPLYSPPSASPEGSRQLLIEPRYSDLTGALRQALHEPTSRLAIARTMMQSDLWSCYDLLYWRLFPEDRGTELDRRKQVVTDLVAQLIVKLALTPEEIQSLPDNYAAARTNNPVLPDLFNPNSGWIEFQYHPDRLHDEAAGFRRVTRIFVKPARPPRDKAQFLDAFREPPQNVPAKLDGAALIIQPLLIDTHGNLSASHVSTEVQIRMFRKSNDGAFARTDLQLCEISRQLMLREPGSGGLAREDENFATYSAAGGEYGFASPIQAGPEDKSPSPVLVKQRTRCTICHGPDLTTPMTFNFALQPHSPLPPIKILDPASHQAADTVTSRKLKRPEWQLLHAYFVPTSSTRH